jgi:outer membrane receptor for monomeric catechols
LAEVLLSASAYHIDWRNLQQQVALPCGYYLQVNGNRARVNGGEFEADGQVAARLSYRVGLGYEDASITDPGPLGSVGIEPGSRISGVPAFTAFAGVKYTQMLDARTSAFVSTDYSYTGNSVSLLVSGGGAQATRPAYSLVNLRFGVQRGQSELSLNLHNLFNAKPNLGDIGYVGYAQFDAAGGVIPQVATLQPLTATLRYAKFF